MGIMLGILGLTAPIVNTFVGSLSSFFPDRYITVRTLAFFAGQSISITCGARSRDCKLVPLQ